MCSDEAVLTSGLLTGEIDGSYPITLSTLDQLRDSDAVNVYEGPGYGIAAFIVSSFDGALADKRVRQALSLAIDRPGLISALYKDAAYPARAVAVPGTWGYEKEQFTAAWNELPDVSAPNLEEAKRLVEEAGATGQTVRLGMSSELGVISAQATEFQRALESIGMEAELVSVSAANYINFFIDPAAREGVDGFFTVNYPNYADPFGIYVSMIAPDGSQALQRVRRSGSRRSGRGHPDRDRRRRPGNEGDRAPGDHHRRDAVGADRRADERAHHEHGHHRRTVDVPVHVRPLGRLHRRRLTPAMCAVRNAGGRDMECEPC